MRLFDKVVRKFKRDGLRSTCVSILQYPFLFNRRLQYKQMLNQSLLKDRFSDIYSKGIWNSEESGSGEGSESNYTQPLRWWLVKKLPELNIKVFVDAPCGDFNWMKKVLPELTLEYLGFDIVESVIIKNKELYQTDKTNFFVENICEDRLPNCDLIMTRDCLFHLSYGDIEKFLKNLSGVEYKYLLTTTHHTDNDFENTNIISGDWRLIDLFSPPFNFDANTVIDRVDDYPKGHNTPRQMILIEKINVPTTLNQNTQ